MSLENMPDDEPSVEQSLGPQPIKTPYHVAIMDIVNKRASDAGQAEQYPPEVVIKVDEVLTLIDRQLVENFSVHVDQETGAQFTYTTFELNQEILQELIKLPAVPAKTNGLNTPRKKLEVIFGAYAFPPDGHALGAQDVAISRIFDQLKRSVQKLKSGEQVQPYKIILVGSVYGLGGTVTRKWISKMRQQGMPAYKDVYGPFIQQQLAGYEPSTLESSPTTGERKKYSSLGDDVTVIGVSKGAVVADQSAQFLPQIWQESIKRLYAIPAGYDTKQSGIKLGLGLAQETIFHLLIDKQIMPTLGALSTDFLAKLQKKHPEIVSQSSLMAMLGAVVEALAIRRTTPLQEQYRSYLQVGSHDPLRHKPPSANADSIQYQLVNDTLKLRKNDLTENGGKADKEKVEIVRVSTINKHLTGAFKGRHFFYTMRIDKWIKTAREMLSIALNR